MYKPIFEKLEGKVIPAHSSAGLAGVKKYGHKKFVSLVSSLTNGWPLSRFALVSRKLLPLVIAPLYSFRKFVQHD